MKAPSEKNVLISMVVAVTFLSCSVAYWEGRQVERKETWITLPPPELAKAGDILVVNEHGQGYWTNPTPKLTARNVKPSKDRAAAAPEELEALDLMRDGNFQAAGKILHDLANKPEPWLINLRKRAGVTNPEAPVGPSWDQIEAWAKEHEAERGKESKP